MSDVNEAAQSLVGNSSFVPMADKAAYEMKTRAAQQRAMTQHVAGRERELRIQVLGLAVSADRAGAAELAKEYWDFVTAGDPVEAEDANRL